MNACTTKVALAAKTLIERCGPMDFLELADMVTEETELPVRDVERALRILLLDGTLLENAEFNVTCGGTGGRRQDLSVSLER